MKKTNFEFGYCCVCNQKKFIHELMICDTSNLHLDLKYMRNSLKMNLKYHFKNDAKFILKELTSDTKHVQQELDGLLLAKDSISITEHQFFVCKTCYVFKKIIKYQNLH